MKRSAKFICGCLAFCAVALPAFPAFAQDYSSNAGNAVFGGFSLLFTCCWGLFALLFLALFVLWIFMLVDAAQRQEYEFPNSSGNSKVLWIVLLIVASWITAIVYYFMVFKKIKRGSITPPPAAPSAAPPMPPAPPAPPAPPMGG